MLGIFVELIISWLLLKFIEHQSLNALGLIPTRKRLAQFAAGLAWSILYIAAFNLVVAMQVHNPYKVNPKYNLHYLNNALLYIFRSVAFEDLIFRGALLYILIQRIGVNKALIISGIAFGIYHWFSWGAFGNPAQMAIIFVMTGMGGYVFALAFERTRSMYLPFALHYGCDFASMVVFSQDKTIGIQWFYKSFAKDPVSPGSLVSIIVLIINFIGFPLFTFLLLKQKRWANYLTGNHLETTITTSEN